MPHTAQDIRAIVHLLDDDQLSMLRYRSMELLDDVSTTDEERNQKFREALEKHLLEASGLL